MAITAGFFTMLAIKYVWPWVIDNIWPRIQEQFISLAVKTLQKLSGLISHEIKHRMNASSTEAEAKARTAERFAASASSDAEREKQEAIAKVWREVAEQFRTENEELRTIIEEISTSEQHNLGAEIISSSPSIEKTKEGLVLTLNGRRTSLPALPNPDE